MKRTILYPGGRDRWRCRRFSSVDGGARTFARGPAPWPLPTRPRRKHGEDPWRQERPLVLTHLTRVIGNVVAAARFALARAFGVLGDRRPRRLAGFAIVLAFTVPPVTAGSGQIAQKPLDEFVIYTVPVAFGSGTTTILFPGEVSGLYAQAVAVQEQENARFVIAFTPGNFYFNVRALRRDAEDHLTVIFQRKAYVLRLVASEKPVFSLTLFADERRGKDRSRGVSPERLLGLLDKAKAYPLFAAHQPDAVAGVLHAAPEIVNYYETFTVHLRDVWRFEEEDTVVFRVELENTSDDTIYYRPQDLAVRVGERIYPQSIADASGVMPPRSITPAFFAITGDGYGGRNHLAPDNAWNILVVRAENPSPSADLLPLPESTPTTK